MSYCSPSRTGNTQTCFNSDELEALALAWNETEHGLEAPIPLERAEAFDENRRRDYLHNALSERFRSHCDANETCWLDNEELNASLRELSPDMHRLIHSSILKPKATKGRHDWLSTYDIDNVMTQIEALFPDFKYIGCFPSDYFLLHPNAFPAEAIRQVPRSAIIFNLDSSKQPGSHWIAMFFHIEPPADYLDDSTAASSRLTIEYFDPTGKPPNKNLQKFLSFFPDAHHIANTFQHQKGDNECGVYSLFFILERLTGREFRELGRKRIPDSSVNRFRNFLFRPYSEEFSLSEGSAVKRHRRRQQ